MKISSNWTREPNVFALSKWHVVYTTNWSSQTIWREEKSNSCAVGLCNAVNCFYFRFVNLVRMSDNEATTSKHDHKVIIIGAGTAGLSAANHLIKNGLTDFRILEAQHRIGGRIVSIDLGAEKVTCVHLPMFDHFWQLDMCICYIIFTNILPVLVADWARRELDTRCIRQSNIWIGHGQWAR